MFRFSGIAIRADWRKGVEGRHIEDFVAVLALSCMLRSSQEEHLCLIRERLLPLDTHFLQVVIPFCES